MQIDPNAAALLLSILTGGSANPAIQASQSIENAQPSFGTLPFGCTGKLPNGYYVAKDVNDLSTWDDNVICENGGTCEGVKVMFMGIKATKRSEKSFSSRDGWMARFEICKAGGRNPMNEVVNIFVKQEKDYKPYLNPANWSVKQAIVVFKSEETTEPDRTFRYNMIYFMDELISDSILRKSQHIGKRLGGMYECFVDGVKLDIEDEN